MKTKMKKLVYLLTGRFSELTKSLRKEKIEGLLKLAKINAQVEVDKAETIYNNHLATLAENDGDDSKKLQTAMELFIKLQNAKQVLLDTELFISDLDSDVEVLE